MVTDQIPIPIIICEKTEFEEKVLFENKEFLELVGKSDLHTQFFELHKSSFELFLANSNIKKYFDVKRAEIFWETKKAILYVFIDESNAQEINLYKDHLLRSVSHDLRTPLNGIMGMMEIAYTTSDLSIIHEKLRIALKTANGLILLVNDILDFARISNSKLEFS